jgi:hypothetical protein
MTFRMSFTESEINADGNYVVSGYGQVWFNFLDDDYNYQNCSQVLKEQYNACIVDGNHVLFGTQEDAVRFILRWS